MRDIFGIGEVGRVDRVMGLGSDFSVQGVQSRLMRVLWTPAELSGAIIFDALDTGKITLVGSKVSAWSDMLGVGVSASQGADAARPTMGTGELTLDGGDVLSITNSKSEAWCKSLHSTGGWIFALVWIGTSSNPNALYSLCGTNNVTNSATGVSVFYDDRSAQSRNNMFGGLATRSSDPAAAQHMVNNVLTPNQYTMIDFVVDPDNATAASRTSLSVDGGLNQTANTQTGVASTANATYNMQIGGAGNGLGLLVGKIKCIAFIPSIPTTDERQKMQGWAAHRHGLTALLPSDHPYKSVHPII